MDKIKTAKLMSVAEELSNQGYIEKVKESFDLVEAMIREVAQQDPSVFTFDEVYFSLKNIHNDKR